MVEQRLRLSSSFFRCWGLLLWLIAFASAAAVGVPIAAERSLVDNPARFLPLEVNYAQVYAPSPVYSSLDDVRAGRIATYHGGSHTWVSVLRSAQVGGRSYYQVRWDWGNSGWMPANALHFNAQLSRLRGVDLRARAGERLAIVYVGALNVRSAPGELSEASRVGQLRAYDVVSVQEERVLNGKRWYRIGDGQWIHSGFVRNFSIRNRPNGVGSDEKWIDVNLSEQVIIAMEGDTPVYAALAATGRPGHETVTGLFRVWTKLRNAPMRSAVSNPPYNYTDMPYIMYFHGSYGIHGVYHHDAFGVVRSAGCINLSPHDAQWFFNWAGPTLEADQREWRPTDEQPGTWVHVAY